MDLKADFAHIAEWFDSSHLSKAAALAQRFEQLAVDITEAVSPDAADKLQGALQHLQASHALAFRAIQAGASAAESVAALVTDPGSVSSPQAATQAATTEPAQAADTAAPVPGDGNAWAGASQGSTDAEAAADADPGDRPVADGSVSLADAQALIGDSAGAQAAEAPAQVAATAPAPMPGRDHPITFDPQAPTA